MMANFIATNTPIAHKAPGDVIRMESAVAAADAASVSTRHVMLRLYRVADNVQIVELPVYSQNLNETPRIVYRNFTLPMNASHGQYKMLVTVHPQNWATPWDKVAQTAVLFDVGTVAPEPEPEPEPEPSPVADLVKISGDDQGGTVGQTQAAPMIVRALNADGDPLSGVVVSWTTTVGSLSQSSGQTDDDGRASVVLTHPATPQRAVVTASVGSQAASFSQTSHMPLYSANSPFPSLLRPAGSGDPLAGGGFLPDDGRSYELIGASSDEFDGSALDTAKWWRRFVYNNGTLDYLNKELQRYRDIHVVSNGSLKLIATPNGSTFTAPSGRVYPMFNSAMIRSRGLIKYGYFEMRVRLPRGKGVWPAGWLLAQSGVQPPEIDIFEYVRNDVNEHAHMLHHNAHGPNSVVRWAEKNYNPQYHYWSRWGAASPTYFIDDWHVISAKWDAPTPTDTGLVTFYIDGFPTVQRRMDWRTSGNADPGLACIMVNLAMGDAWPTSNWSLDVSTDPQTLEIDYVRTWQVSGQIITGISPL